MSEDRQPPRRMQSQTERDVDGIKAKSERDAARCIPTEVDEEITGNHQGEDLARKRSNRPTDERIGRLEVKHDTLSKDIGELKVTMGGVSAQMEVWPKLVKQLETAVNRSLNREDMTFTAQLDVHGKAAIADIDVDTKRKTAQIETGRVAKIAIIEVTKTAALKVIAAIAGSGIILWIGSQLGNCGGG